MLIFIVGTLVFAQGWAMLDAKLAAVAGAREAARTFSEQPASAGAAAVRNAVAAGESAMAGQRPGTRAQVSLVGGTRLRRCARATFEAAATVQPMGLPFVSRAPVTMRARATELVDPFRHGLRGRAPCDG